MGGRLLSRLGRLAQKKEQGLRPEFEEAVKDRVGFHLLDRKVHPIRRQRRVLSSGDGLNFLIAENREVRHNG
jgi:hypothetical protein